MKPTAYYPYKSEAARDTCFAYLDACAAKEWPVPSEARTVRTVYGPTFVRVSGPAGAPPLVLLPGAASSSLMWRPNVAALSAAYRTYAVDQIGDFGRSNLTRPLRDFGDLVTWLDSLFDALELGGGINLVGISFGGALAAHYALRRPDRAGKVVLLAPGATVYRLNVEFVVRLIWAAVSARKRLPQLVRWMFADAACKDPAWLASVTEQLMLNMNSLERRGIPNPKVWSDAEWAALKVPALFLVGEHEVIYPPGKVVRRLQRVAPQVRAEIVPGAGHDLTFAQAELVNRLILDFLAPQPATVGPTAERAT